MSVLDPLPDDPLPVADPPTMATVLAFPASPRPERVPTPMTVPMTVPVPVPVTVPIPVPLDRRGLLDEAVHRAVRRDLHRLGRALAAPVTAVRRAAIVRHIEFLVPRLLAHHAGEDRHWAGICVHRPDLVARAAAARAEHRGVRRAGQDLLSATRTWAADGGADARRALRRQVLDLNGLVTEQFRRDELDRVLLAGERSVPDHRMPGHLTARRSRRGPARRPAAVAHEVFWLVDELDPTLAGRVVDRHSRPARWAMRNVFSGGYNRSAHLMWVGGGDGPAV